MSVGSTGSSIPTGGIDSTVKLWTTDDFGARPLTLRGHSAAVYDVDFSPDGVHLVSGSRDRTARIFALDVDELLSLGDAHLTRSLSSEECQQYLHVADCT